jgi:hypothetical protein
MKPGINDEVAFIHLTLYGNGAMSVSGNIGDKKLALGMLDSARDVVNSQSRPEDKPILVPSRDVVAPQHPNYPTKALGDMK